MVGEFNAISTVFIVEVHLSILASLQALSVKSKPILKFPCKNPNNDVSTRQVQIVGLCSQYKRKPNDWPEEKRRGDETSFYFFQESFLCARIAELDLAVS